MITARYPVLHAEICKLAPVPVEEWRLLEAHFSPKKVRKGELLLKPGDEASLWAFILSGLMRHYYVDKNGDEATKAFRTKGEMSAAYAELLLGVPSRTYVEAVEESELLVVDFNRVSGLYKRNACWQELGRRIAELHYVNKERREFEFLQLSATERYLAFDLEYPGLSERIPQYHIASYLGITPVALSRIAAGLRKKTKKKR